MWCGCFYCLRTYPATEVVDWIDDGETPLCPHCGIDSVMLEVTDLGTLLSMRSRRFSQLEAPPEPLSRATPPSGTPKPESE